MARTGTILFLTSCPLAWGGSEELRRNSGRAPRCGYRIRTGRSESWPRGPLHARWAELRRAGVGVNDFSCLRARSGRARCREAVPAGPRPTGLAAAEPGARGESLPAAALLPRGVAEAAVNDALERAWARREGWSAIGAAAAHVRTLFSEDPCGTFSDRLERIHGAAKRAPLRTVPARQLR